MKISKGQEAYQGFSYRRCYRPLVNGSFFIVGHVGCRVITSVALAHLVDATQHKGWWVGWGLFDATQNIEWVAGWVVIPAFCRLG